MSLTPEQEARIEIDRMLHESGWLVQDVKSVNLHAGRGVAICEFPLERGFGYADYLLYIDGKAAGVIEAKKAGVTLSGVEIQSDRYTQGLSLSLPAWFRPLPFRYQSTGIETCFTSGLDPDPRSFFEQMKGCGVRVINDTDLLAVTPDAVAKTHFVIVDAVGVCEQDKTDSRPLEKKPTVSLEKLLQAVALGNTESEVVSSIAGRFARLERKLDAVGKATSSAGGWSGYATMLLPVWRSGGMISSLHRSRRTAGSARCISCLERSCGGCWRS